jgi:glucosamine-6-phosphate deaminase
MEIIIQPSADDACSIAARIIANQIRNQPATVLGLATGSTPLPLYRKLIHMHRQEGLDFSQVVTFNLDEYIGLPPQHPASYYHFMHEHLFSAINLSAGNIHLPDGMTHDVPAACAYYEKRIRDAGGIDIQVLGIGSDGHIGFNEPTSSLSSRTRIKTLTARTREDNARFFKQPDEQPHHVITMGIGTIMESRRILLLAFGENKSNAVAATVEGPVTASVPASVLQLHAQTHMCIDHAAALKLERKEYYRWVYEHKPEWQRY